MSGSRHILHNAEVLYKDGHGTPGCVVAFQDMRAGPPSVALTRVRRPGEAAAAPPVRIDDTGDGVSAQWRPALVQTVGGRRVLAAWEDDRDGPTNVFAAAAPVDRLP